MSIFSLARACDDILSDILGSIQATQYAHRWDTFDESLGRLRVWAGNLGAYRNPSSASSLDYRLRSADEIREALEDELTNIRDWSTKASHIVNGMLENRTFVETSVDTTEAKATEHNELDELSSGIDAAVNVLFRLSMVVRQSRPRGKVVLPESFLRQDPTLDIRHVIDKFAKTKKTPWLAERLGRSITERRDTIRYRQEHRQRLAASHASEDLVPEGVEMTPSTIATTHEQVVIEESTVIEEQSLKAKSSNTVATSFVAILGDGSDELKIPDLELLRFNNRSLKYDEPFECPFCRTIQELNTYEDWKKHVFSDLQPYTCTFDDCTSEFFASRHEWFRHEMSIHRREWFCSECKDKVFTRNAELITHLADVHHIQNVSQLPHLTTACQKPIQNFVEGSCPLCDNWTPSAHVGENINDFRRHLGHHLQQLALLALPQDIDGLELLGDELIKPIALEDEAQSYPGHSTDSDIPSTEPTVNELDVQVMEIKKRIHREEHPDTLTSMINLALTYSNQGRWKKAEELFVQVMETSKRVLGEEYPDTLTSMVNLASTYSNQRRWKEAEELFVQVIETSKRVLGEEYPDTLTSMVNLASTYSNQRRWKEAEELFVQVMETSKRVLGEEHPDTLTSMGNLASIYSNQRRWKEAEELFVQVIKTSKRVLGEERPDTLTSMGNLALTYSNQGRWKEAEELFVQVMETSKRVLGEEHLSTLTSMGNLALTYSNQRRRKEAEELFVQVMEISKKVLGEEHLSTLTSMGNLASTYSNQRRWKEAEELFVQVIKTSKRVLGEEHPDTLTSMVNLASTYSNQRRRKEAEELFVQVMETSRRVLGEEHPDTLTSMGNLASTYSNQRRWKEAEELFVQVIETGKRVLGEEHLSTLTSMGNLALMYSNQRRWKEAEELFVQVIKTSKRVLGGEHLSTLTSMVNLALMYMKQGQWKEAEELFVQVVETRKRVLGEEHTDTLASMKDLAFTFKAQGLDEEAFQLLGKCLRAARKTLGPMHSNILSSLKVLDEWQKSLDTRLNVGDERAAKTSELGTPAPSHPFTTA